MIKNYICYTDYIKIKRVNDMNPNRNESVFLSLLAAGMIVFSGCAPTGNAASNLPSSTTSEQNNSSENSTAPEISQSASSSLPLSSPAAPEVPTASAAPVNAVKESEKADLSYLDDTVFIGDSVTLKLKNYVTAKRKTTPGFFGKAQFLAAGSMGSANALQPLGVSSIHPAYNGQKQLLEDNVAAMGAKKVYIMLGANDIALYGVDGSVTNMKKLLKNIKVRSPDIEIFVQSATPMLKEKQMKQLNNNNLILYDNALSAMCKEERYSFVDVACALRSKDGSLPPEYCSDPNILGIHFTDKACEIWIDYILTHTVKQ